MLVTVEPEALVEWSAHARRAGTRLESRLTTLDDGLAPLVASWQGAAAEGFAARHRQWRRAADGLLGTLAALAELVETAHANYTAAAATNVRIWRTGPSGAVVVEAMGTGRGRITAHLEEIRATVTGLVAATDDHAAAWDALATGLTGSYGMAGGDAAGLAFAADYDGMAAAAWQGWRSSTLMLDGIAGGLAATGNNVAEAERKSTPGALRSFAPITARTTPPPAPPPAPSPAGGPDVDALAAYWPTADPARLRTAATAWRTSATSLHAAAARAYHAADALVATSDDPALAQMHRFTGAALSGDPTSGPVGVLVGTGGRIASACDGLADVTEHTRGRIIATVAHYAGGEEWYHPVADIIDRLVRFKIAHALAAAGDAYLLDLDLSEIRDDHVRAVEAVRQELHPAGADRMARIATAMVPPRPIPANTCAVRSPDGPLGDPVPEAQRQALIAEVTAGGDRIRPAEVLQITRGWDGKPVWIARGNGRAGLQHLLRPERILAFLDQGVAPGDVPGLALRTVAQGPPIGRTTRADRAEDEELLRQGKEPGYVYSVDIGGRPRNIVVLTSTSGFVVTAYPYSKKIWPLQEARR